MSLKKIQDLSLIKEVTSSLLVTHTSRIIDLPLSRVQLKHSI